MTLQHYMIKVFENWSPLAPEVVHRTKSSITLNWGKLEPFSFLADNLLYRVQKNNKIPKWINVYSGGKSTKTIENLAPCHPHRFRLKVMLKPEAVPHFSERAVEFFGNESAVYDKMSEFDIQERSTVNHTNTNVIHVESEESEIVEVGDGDIQEKRLNICATTSKSDRGKNWIESSWSEETWTNTDTDGSSAVCFSMAVRCGYFKQVQAMLEERPDLVGIINTNNGFTPLATAVRKGDVNMVRYLLLAGADVDQYSSTGQTALHLAILSANIAVAELLMDREADFKALDWNGLRAEHYAVDSCNLEMLIFVLNKGGDISVEDNNGWTPLFRALCQGAKTEIIEELVQRGSDVEAKDRAGLPLASVARLLKNRQGRSRDSVIGLVDSTYPHEKAVANFTRLTKKIYNVQSAIKLS